MNVIKQYSPSLPFQGRYPLRLRQTALAGLSAAMFTLAGCGGGGPEVGDLGYVEGFLGGVMADEPRAALVGREVLAAGGSAADAAVAAYRAARDAYTATSAAEDGQRRAGE